MESVFAPPKFSLADMIPFANFQALILLNKFLIVLAFSWLQVIDMKDFNSVFDDALKIRC